jgi:transposase
MGEVHVLTGPERRRYWSDDQKRALVAAAFAPGAVVRGIARRADLCPSLLYRWRREFAVERPGFAEMVVVPAGLGEERPMPIAPVVEIEFGKVRMRIPGSTAPDLAAAIVKALAGR